MENLDKAGAFSGLLSRTDRVNDQGQLESVIETTYLPTAGIAASRREGGRPQGNGPPVTLGKRILVEKRALIIPLALGIILNVAAYALIVYPLGVKSVGAADRAVAAAQAASTRARA